MRRLYTRAERRRLDRAGRPRRTDTASGSGRRVPPALHELQEVASRGADRLGPLAALPGHDDDLVDQVLGLGDRDLEVRELAGALLGDGAAVSGRAGRQQREGACRQPASRDRAATTAARRRRPVTARPAAGRGEAASGQRRSDDQTGEDHPGEEDQDRAQAIAGAASSGCRGHRRGVTGGVGSRQTCPVVGVDGVVGGTVPVPPPASGLASRPEPRGSTTAPVAAGSRCDPPPPAPPPVDPPGFGGVSALAPPVPVVHCVGPPFLSHSGGKGAVLAMPPGTRPCGCCILVMSASAGSMPGIFLTTSRPACTRFFGSGRVAELGGRVLALAEEVVGELAEGVALVRG